MKFVVFAALVVLASAAPAGAGYFEGALAIERGDYAVALRELRPLAEKGHAQAQFKLGRMYRAGAGVPRDAVLAAQWTAKAAEQGDALAQYDLGMFYATGQGVARDYVQAHLWFDLAARQDLSADRVSRRAAKFRDLVAKELTPGEVLRARHLAREWLERKRAPE